MRTLNKTKTHFLGDFVFVFAPDKHWPQCQILKYNSKNQNMDLRGVSEGISKAVNVSSYRLTIIFIPLFYTKSAEFRTFRSCWQASTWPGFFELLSKETVQFS